MLEPFCFDFNNVNTTMDSHEYTSVKVSMTKCCYTYLNAQTKVTGSNIHM